MKQKTKEGMTDMKCCNHTPGNGSKQENKHKGHMSHMWMMALCCGAPLILLMLIPVIGAVIPSLTGVLTKIIPFICPIMMIMMIPMMFRKDKGNDAGNDHCDTKQIENKQLE